MLAPAVRTFSRSLGVCARTSGGIVAQRAVSVVARGGSGSELARAHRVFSSVASHSVQGQHGGQHQEQNDEEPTKKSRPLPVCYAGTAAFAAFLAWMFYPTEKASSEPASTKLSNGLDTANFVPLKLIKVEKYNHDTSVFYLALPAGPDARSQLTVSSFVLVRTDVDGKAEIRPYTPIDQHENGVIKLLIKDYPAGKLSRFFHTRKVGDLIELKGPLPKIKYVANSKNHIGMIAGGTGITPFLQVIEEVVSNPEDKTRVTLLFANKTPADILLKERLDKIVAKHRNINVIYSVDNPDAKWKGKSGFVTPALIKDTMPSPTDPGSQVFVCGPPGFMKAYSGPKKSPTDQGELEGALKDLGYTKNNVFKF